MYCMIYGWIYGVNRRRLLKQAKANKISTYTPYVMVITAT